MFLVYQGWTGTVDGKIYNAYRTWGRADPNPAVAEVTNPEVRKTNTRATIVRSVLRLPESSSLEPRVVSLCDISGRRVVDLRPGANDVRALAPGVYFVRRSKTEDGRPTADISKVVVAR
jgi:hypothetical protein